MNITMTSSSDLTPSSHDHRPGKATRFRNALARRKLERRLDKQLLRIHLTEVWEEKTS